MTSTRRKRVLLINTGYDATGADRAARELFERLPAVGWDAELFVGRGPVKPVPGVHVVPWRAERWLTPLDVIWPHNDWRHFGSRWKLSRVCPDRFDLVHVHATLGRWLSLRALSKLSYSIPTVWTHHDDSPVHGGMLWNLAPLLSRESIAALMPRFRPVPKYQSSWRTRPFDAALDRWPVRARAIVTPSEYQRGTVLASLRYRTVPVHAIYNGLSMLEVESRVMDRRFARDRWSLMPDIPTVLLIAATLDEPHKGMAFAIDALRSLSAHIPVQALVLGRRAQPIAVRLRDRLSVRTGYAADPEALAAAYRAADVTLIPSLMESLSYVGMESLACSTPFVCFAVGGVGELAALSGQATARLADSVGLGLELRALIVDSVAREARGAVGRLWVEANVSMHSYLDQLTAVYDAALSIR